MSDFSVCLTRMKDKRKINAARMAEICDLDTTVVFSWLKGKRTPSDINKVRQIGIKMRLSEAEKIELEKAYMVTVLGRDKYDNYKNVYDIICLLNTTSREKGMGVGQVSGTDQNEKKKDREAVDYKILGSNMEILNVIVASLSRMTSSDKVSVFHHVPCKVVNDILQFYGWNRQFRMDQIIYWKKRSEDDPHDTAILKEILPIVFLDSHRETYLSEIGNNEGMSFILSDDFYIQFNKDLSEGLYVTDKDWIRMKKDIYQFFKENGRKISKTEINGINYATQKYCKESKISVIEFQPCMAGVLDEQILREHLFPDIPHVEKLIQRIAQSGRV